MALRKAQSKNARSEGEISETLLGVDCKRMPNTDSIFHNRRKFQSYQEEETKFVKSVANNHKLLQSIAKFQPKGLVQKEINCADHNISVRFTSPLDNIFDLQRNQCEDLIKEIHSDDSGSRKDRPKVIAANLRWKSGVTVKQTTGKNFRNVTREANPTTTSTFEFGSKTKFEKNVLKDICSELFPDNDVVVLNGNNCHGEIEIGNSKNSQKGQNREAELVYQSSTPYYGENNEEDVVTTVGEYFDDEERKFLLVPSSNKGGLDTDTEKRYIFPYSAKFTVGKEKVKFEHSFQLQLALSQTPQHYGLVFTFPLKDKKVHIVKSLISVYSVYPQSAQQCSITTYALETKPQAFQSRSNPKSLMANFSSFVEANLREEKLIKMFLRRQFSISCDLARSQNTKRRLYKADHLEMKHKNKQEILKHVKADVKCS